jgi:hypothetical protein
MAEQNLSFVGRVCGSSINEFYGVLHLEVDMMNYAAARADGFLTNLELDGTTGTPTVFILMKKRVVEIYREFQGTDELIRVFLGKGMNFTVEIPGLG